MSFEECEKKPLITGPWGGQGGARFDDGVFSSVRQMVIAYGAGIDSIQIEYDKNGSSIWSQKHGGNGGTRTDKVKLDYPDEYLISIHGCYGSMAERGAVIVRSLTLESNKKTYGPFGVEKGTLFSVPASGAKIVGFHGKCGWYLDSVGVYLKALPRLNPSKALAPPQNYVANGTERHGYSIIQGSVGQNYDIVLALRQKEGSGKPPASKLSRQSSGSSSSSSSGSSDEETTPKNPSTIQKVPKKMEGLLTFGPWGGTGGASFDDGCNTGIRQVNLSRNVGIVSIKVLYDRDGQAIWGSKHGGTGGFKKEQIMFDYPSEVLTHITGTYGPLMYMGPTIMRSITFHTNRGKHGPYGEEQGPSFTSLMKEGKIVGFHGREGLFLDAIGVHAVEGKVAAPPHPLSNAMVKYEGAVAEIVNPPWSNKLVLAKGGQTAAEEVALGVVKEPAPCGPGPWGGDGGRAWDDGVFSGIKQMFVTRAEAGVCSIQIEYDRNGQSLWSVKHGGNGGAVTHRVKLEYPHEVLICVSGYYGPIPKDEQLKVIKSLTFYTTRGKYGPFGDEMGTFFTSNTTQGKVVGFHGRSSTYLDAIGVHMQHWLGSHKTHRSSLLKLFG